MGHGLCSAIYKARSSLQAVIREGGVPGYACLKQVDVDVQNAPHDIQREIALLQRTRHANLSVLLAAFTDTPDPFTTIYNLVMPLYPIQLTEFSTVHTSNQRTALCPTLPTKTFPGFVCWAHIRLLPWFLPASNN